MFFVVYKQKSTSRKPLKRCCKPTINYLREGIEQRSRFSLKTSAASREGQQVAHIFYYPNKEYTGAQTIVSPLWPVYTARRADTSARFNTGADLFILEIIETLKNLSRTMVQLFYRPCSRATVENLLRSEVSYIPTSFLYTYVRIHRIHLIPKHNVRFTRALHHTPVIVACMIIKSVECSR